ncbi:hypothetical protein ACH79_28495 [Bradyrhizobium sp. CCBAU 051011]|uniref:hypothetical protein n=1 Tax=Bradyrhizobium sp. CCBAU 051011 TaxID=858422 RepID=UPI001374695D|nr:hypothetical protein [Bradyrhizobium sp. CCBAU 051011]QHO75966.1 hypothetical protein ACH79_28495 [Bradyrhizobium sp. CCBAU 051011]
MSPAFNLPTERVLLGTTAMWNAESKWTDRDGLPIPPTPKLVIGMRRIVRRWLDHTPIDITEQPLPDVDTLNAAIPKPWRPGLNGQEEPPYAVHYVVQFCDPQTGQLYTFVNKTYGSKLAYDQLEEQIAVMSALRGANVVAVVLLDQAPMKTRNYGMKLRPHFKVIDFKVPPGSGADGEQLTPQSPPPQLSGATGAAAPVPKPDTSAAPALASPPSPDPETKAALTLDQMKSAKPVTVGEIINDELPPWA